MYHKHILSLLSKLKMWKDKKRTWKHKPKKESFLLFLHTLGSLFLFPFFFFYKWLLFFFFLFPFALSATLFLFSTRKTLTNFLSFLLFASVSSPLNGPTLLSPFFSLVTRKTNPSSLLTLAIYSQLMAILMTWRAWLLHEQHGQQHGVGMLQVGACCRVVGVL